MAEEREWQEEHYPAGLTPYQGKVVELGETCVYISIDDLVVGELYDKEYLQTAQLEDIVSVYINHYSKQKHCAVLAIKEKYDVKYDALTQMFPLGVIIEDELVSITNKRHYLQLTPEIAGVICYNSYKSPAVSEKHHVFQIGETVQACVIGHNVLDNKIYLSYNIVGRLGVEGIFAQYPVGTVFDGKVVSIEYYGVFVRVVNGFQGLVYKELLSDDPVNDPRDLVSVGDIITVRVQHIDYKNKRMQLTCKTSKEKLVAICKERYPVGSTVTGKVTGKAKFGFFIEMTKGIRGMVHFSEIGYGDPSEELNKINMGDIVTAKVIEGYEPDNPSRIALSVKALLPKQEEVTAVQHNLTEQAEDRAAENTNQPKPEAITAENTRQPQQEQSQRSSQPKQGLCKTAIATGKTLFTKYQEVIRYLFFGVLATVLNIVIYTAFNLAFGYAFANGVGNAIDNIICILFAYATNRAFVFQSKTVGRAAYKEFVQFVLCRIGTLVADVTIMYFGGTVLGEWLVPAAYLAIWSIGMKVLANVVVVVLNYVFSKLIIFKHK